MLFVFSSCNLFHQHSWENYLAKSPTCTDTGILKKLCLECGSAEFVEINPIEHEYINGVCTVCGSKGSDKKLVNIETPFNSDNSGAWSFDKIYEFITDVGYTKSYSDYMRIMSNSTAGFDSASIDSFGNLNASFSYTFQSGNYKVPLTVKVTKVSPENPESSVGRIIRVDVIKSDIYISYSDGSQVYAGSFKQDKANRIIGFGINVENELIIYYFNNTISFCGNISN